MSRVEPTNVFNYWAEIQNVLQSPQDIDRITNLSELMVNQQKKMQELRNVVKELEFVPLDPGGSYESVSFKAFDGGMFSLNFDPFEFDIVSVADSNGNRKLEFASPSGDMGNDDELKKIIEPFEREPVIRNFLDLLDKTELLKISEILTRRDTLMEIGEFACMFDKVQTAQTDDKTLIMRDRLLRTKKIKAELIGKLKENLLTKKDHVWMVGVAKTSKILFLLQAALVCEKVFPTDHIGYVKIPLDVERRAYTWSGHGLLKPDENKPLDYSFGDLYIAKLSRQKNLLVTIEIPSMIDKDIYSKDDVMNIISYLAKDSRTSYPNIGYPQTLMRAHEYAVQQGFPTSITRDRIIEKLRQNSDPVLSDYIRDQAMQADNLDKGWLGGRA